MPLSHHYAAALPLSTCAVNPVNYWEGEAVWNTVRKSATTTTFFKVLCAYVTFPQVIGHDDDKHMCSTPVHMCGEVWINLKFCKLLFYDHAGFLALRPQRNEITRRKHLFLSRTL